MNKKKGGEGVYSSIGFIKMTYKEDRARLLANEVH